MDHIEIDPSLETDWVTNGVPDDRYVHEYVSSAPKEFITLCLGLQKGNEDPRGRYIDRDVSVLS
jgi:hypothetical protein